MKRILVPTLVLALAATAAAQDQQLGARTKAMGGSYTAFDDDPVSVWLNPAGIATQPDQMSIAYQTYTAYPKGRERGPNDTIEFTVDAEPQQGDPALLPAYIGFTFQMGTPEMPMAIGFCYATPYLLNYAMDQVLDPNQPAFVPEAEVEQTMSRFRVAYAVDFLIKERGEAGWFNHVAFGMGLDIGVEKWQFSGVNEDISDTTSGFGMGLGGLLGLYDNASDVKVNLGVAFQSAVNYAFEIDPDVFPAFDMPHQLNLGATFFLLEESPLRITLDMQWIQWSATAEDPVYANFEGFEDAINFSIGGEYRFRLSPTMNLYPRMGFRRFDAPWDDADNLPMTGAYRLVLDSNADIFNILTLGGGLSWVTEAGKLRSLDLAVDVGGDAFNMAAGFTYEF